MALGGYSETYWHAPLRNRDAPYGVFAPPVKDVDFECNQIVIRDGKGQKDRITVLPAVVKDGLREHLKEVKQLYEKDISDGFGCVFLPGALARKYPNAEQG